MIKALQDWAVVLSGLAVFGALCEEILPEGSFQKYIRLGLGMLLVLVLLSPLQNLFRQDWEITESKKRWAYRETRVMEEKQREEILRIYQLKLNRKMTEVLKESVPDFSGLVQCHVSEDEESFGNIEHVSVIAEGSGAEIRQIQHALKEGFRLSPEQITVRF